VVRRTEIVEHARKNRLGTLAIKPLASNRLEFRLGHRLRLGLSHVCDGLRFRLRL
jgi:hypothetical protein